MSDTSQRLSLPYIMPGQAQKHVTHNEAVRALDSLVHASVSARNVTTPPSTIANGDYVLIGDSAADAFAGKDNQLAGFVDGAWMFYPPVQGLIVNIEDEAASVIWRGVAWEDFAAGGTVDISALSFDIFGINGTADSYNRLLLNSAASLFNHDGAGHQLKINKATSADTASVLYQTGFSGRAEMGLAGEDDFSFKVSANGTNWKQAMSIEGVSGAVSFPNSKHLTRPVMFNMFGDGGRFGGKPEPLDVRLNNGFSAPNYIKKFNSAVLVEGSKFIDNSDNYGGNRGTMPSHMEDLAEKMKPGASNGVLRYGVEFYTLSVTAGSGTGGALTVGGVTGYLALTGLRYPLPNRFTLSFWVRPSAGQCFIGAHNQTRLFIDGTEVFASTELPYETWTQVTRVVEYAPNVFTGYEASPYRLYLTTGGAFDLAAPVLFPGTLLPDVDAPIGVSSSLTAFM